jgi:hypothetical protein
MLSRWSWVVFVLIGGLGVTMGARMLFVPSMFTELMAGVGPALPDGLTHPDSLPFLSFMGFWTATALVGVNLLTVVVASTALRRRERWAAWAMLYWPLMFAAHLLVYEDTTMRAVQVGWIVLSLGAIAAALRGGPERAGAPA